MHNRRQTDGKGTRGDGGLRAVGGSAAARELAC